MYYIFKFLKWLRKFVLYTVLRKNTRGVRIILKDGDKILLVRHPYDTYWVLPGGGIDAHESPEQAARHEVTEETPYKITGEIKLLGIYKNTSGGKRDTVTVFVAEHFALSKIVHNIIDRIEIQKCEWFSTFSLPEISVATRARIDELSSNHYTSELRSW